MDFSLTINNASFEEITTIFARLASPHFSEMEYEPPEEPEPDPVSFTRDDLIHLANDYCKKFSKNDFRSLLVNNFKVNNASNLNETQINEMCRILQGELNA